MAKNIACISCLMLVLALSAAENMETRLAFLAQSLDSALDASITPCTLAVFPFEDKRPEKDNASGIAIAEEMVRLLSAKKRFVIVERGQFRKIASEISLSQTGLIDDQAALEAGKMLAARYVLAGALTSAFGQANIAARIIRTETAEVVASAAAAAPAMDIGAFAKDLLSEKNQVTSSLFRSMVVPGWGQFYTNHPIRGSVSLACFLGAAAYMAYCIADQSGKSNDYTSYSGLFVTQAYDDSVTNNAGYIDRYQQEKDRLYSSYTDARSQMTLSIIITSAVYAANLGDALFAGFEAKRKFKPYFTLGPDAMFRLNITCSIQ